MLPGTSVQVDGAGFSLTVRRLDPATITGFNVVTGVDPAVNGGAGFIVSPHRQSAAIRAEADAGAKKIIRAGIGGLE